MSSRETTRERASPAETRAAIREATHRALCAHGYAILPILTIALIVSGFDVTAAVPRFRYGTKGNHLAAFSDRSFEEHVSQFAVTGGTRA